MAIQSNFPAIRPSLLLDFANSKRMDPRVTFTRASTARYYDGSTVAKAEENLLQQSADFSSGLWSKTAGTITANTATAPDGTTTADSLIATAGELGAPRLTQSQALAGNLTYTVSAFCKANGTNFAFLSYRTSSTNWAGAEFNLSTGAVSRTASNGTVTYVSGAVSDAGSGWYRCSITVTPTDVAQFVFLGSSDGTSTFSGGFPAFTNAGTENIYIWGAQLEQRSAVTAYTPTTTAPITNYVPVLQTAAAGVPRFDHNPITGESLGLLIEEQRANLMTYSEDFSNAAWTKSRTAVSANSQIAPDGTLTADSLIATSVSGTHRVYQTAAKAASAITYTFSCYIKAAGYGFAMVRISNSSESNSASCGVNLTTGATAVGASGFTNASGAAVNVGNGWWRVSITATSDTDTSVTGFVFIQDSLSNGALTFTGNDYAGVYVWGAQLEAGAFPTSYIPTVAASATRQADAASMTGTNFSSWYDAAEGTFYTDAAVATVASTTDQHLWSAYLSSTNFVRLHISSTLPANPRFAVSVGGTSQADIVTGAVMANTAFRMASTYRVNDFAQSLNAGAAATDTSGLVPAGLLALHIGSLNSASQFMNGTIRKLAYYPLRLTNAQLQAITG